MQRDELKKIIAESITEVVLSADVQEIILERILTSINRQNVMVRSITRGAKSSTSTLGWDPSISGGCGTIKLTRASGGCGGGMGGCG